MIQEIFNRKAPDFECLLKHGFTKRGADYYLEKVLEDARYKLDMRVTESGAVKSSLFVKSGSEYNELVKPSSPADHAAFQASLELLDEIASLCFSPTPFLGEQANRIVRKIEAAYNEKPDFLWSNFPDYAVFRNRESRKWFALIMNIPPQKLAVKDAAQKARIPASIIAKPEIEIIDVKIPADQILPLIKENGIFPGYHMDAKHWISILLEGIVPDERIMDLVAMSHKATE